MDGWTDGWMSWSCLQSHGELHTRFMVGAPHVCKAMGSSYHEAGVETDSGAPEVSFRCQRDLCHFN